ncbi:MAG: CBS domain-containing protein [Actinomycetota bacterium]|nr:CBS domain-containing protein [Actinomycetota bacterium]
MPKSIREVMTPEPRTLQTTATVEEAAQVMRDDDIGDVIVVDDKGKIQGIVTDRDITLRVVAQSGDPKAVKLEEIASKDIITLPLSGTAEAALSLMRDKAIRRLPIVDDGKPVGVVSLGDLAIEEAPESPLAEISAAPPDDAEEGNGSVTGPMRSIRVSQALPVAALGAGLGFSLGALRNRSRQRDLAKKLRKATKKLRKVGDRNIGRSDIRKRLKAAADRD